VKRLSAQRAFGALALVCALAQAAEAGDAPGAAAPESPAWLAPLAGVKLQAIDGSMLTLAPSEGGFALALMAPNGASQRFSWSFVSERMGTIADDADTGHVIGFFRETGTGLEAQFADGRSQSLVANSAGGLSLTNRAATGEASCSVWYPAGHVFGAAEKQAALAAYADRLGLAAAAKKQTHAAAPVCAPALRAAKKQIAQTPLPAPGPYKIGMYKGTAVTNSGAAGLTQIAVRTSEVHLIDQAVAAPLAAISPPAATTQPAAPVVQQAVQPAAQQTSAPAQLTLAAAVPDGHGASDCLSIESDGANVGFRNRCAYGVQFAYCLQKASDPAADCGAGAKAGAVSANGFVLLLSDTNIKSADAERDFRWVACSGSNGSVVAHLDRADPPAGRCVRANQS
jgi:hypothetical protein